MKGLLSITIAVSILGASSAAGAQQQTGPGDSPYMMGNSGWWTLFGPLTMIVYIALVVAVIVLMVDHHSQPA